jgi:hypothetical protein
MSAAAIQLRWLMYHTVCIDGYTLEDRTGPETVADKTVEDTVGHGSVSVDEVGLARSMRRRQRAFVHAQRPLSGRSNVPSCEYTPGLKSKANDRLV